MTWKDVARDPWRQAEARLVEHEELRARHQGTAERQHLSLAAGQRVRELRAALLQAGEACVDRRQIVLCLAVAQQPGKGAEPQIVFDRHFAK